MPSPLRWRGAGAPWSSARKAERQASTAQGRAVDRIPILKLGDVLLVTIQVDMHDQLAHGARRGSDEPDRQVSARGVLIDISALEIVDSFIGRMLDNIAAVSRVLDADTVVVGMRPAVAITLVELGLSLNGVKTALERRSRHGAARAPRPSARPTTTTVSERPGNPQLRRMSCGCGSACARLRSRRA